MADLSNTCIGFLGCGKISAAVCRGYAGAAGNRRPKKILVSLRTESKSKALQAAFPDLVFIVESNEALVAEADVIMIGLLPQVAREVLPALNIAPTKMVISMMAAVDLAETLALTKMPADRYIN
jgi:pyrroline-5-carboxylate reductase